MDISEYHQNIHGYHTNILYHPDCLLPSTVDWQSVRHKCYLELLDSMAHFNVVVRGTENSTHQMKRLTGSPGFFEHLGDKV